MGLLQGCGGATQQICREGKGREARGLSEEGSPRRRSCCLQLRSMPQLSLPSMARAGRCATASVRLNSPTVTS
jgi:hypothetical protein